MDEDPAQLAPTGVVAGLSIDDELLRVVVIERGEAPAVVDGAEADLDPRAVQGGRVLDRGLLGRRIAELWQELSLSGVPTFIGFQPDDAQVRTVLVQGWPEQGWPAEVVRVVELVRGRYQDEPVWNGAPLWRDQAVAARVAACRRPDVSSVVAAARSGGVWVAGVELASLALERSLQRIAPPFTLVVDRTGPGPATLLLLDHGVAVLGWRRTLGHEVTGAGELRVYLLDEGTAVGIAQGTLAAEEWLLRPPPLSWRTAVLLEPGHGLAPESAVPSAPFAAALGLAFGAAGVGARPVELQAPLLHSSLGLLHDRTILTSPTAPPAGEGGATTAGEDPIDGSAQPVVELAEPVIERDEPVVELADPVIDLEEPVVDLDDLADLVEAAVAAVAEAEAAKATVPREPAGPAGDPPVAAVVDAVAGADGGSVLVGEPPVDRETGVAGDLTDGADLTSGGVPGVGGDLGVGGEPGEAEPPPAAEGPQGSPADGSDDPRAWPPPQGPPVGSGPRPGPPPPSPPGGGPLDEDEAFAEALRAAWGARPQVRRLDAAAPGEVTRRSDGDGSSPVRDAAEQQQTCAAEVDGPAGAIATVVVRPTLFRLTVPLLAPEGGDGADPAGRTRVVPEPVTPPAPEDGGARPGTEVGSAPRTVGRSRRRTRRTLLVALLAGVGAFVVARTAGNGPPAEPGDGGRPVQTAPTAATGVETGATVGGDAGRVSGSTIPVVGTSNPTSAGTATTSR